MEEYQRNTIQYKNKKGNGSISVVIPIGWARYHNLTGGAEVTLLITNNVMILIPADKKALLDKVKSLAEEIDQIKGG